MVLVDTSVWIAHFREGNSQLRALLQEEEVLCHPFIVGELACGHMENRAEVLTHLQALPTARMATDEEVLRFIEANALMGTGLGLIDIHLLASALLSNASLWTMDKQLKRGCASLRVAY